MEGSPILLTEGGWVPYLQGGARLKKVGGGDSPAPKHYSA